MELFMNSTVNEVLQFVRENDVTFVRLGFCDPFGVHKNISIMSDELEHAFKYGIPFDASAISGFKNISSSDLLLFPDPNTLTFLPWRPGPGRVLRLYCDIKTHDGEIFSQDSRNILKGVLEKLKKKAYTCKIGVECEFYLFKTDENSNPTYETLDYGSYLDISPLDKGENIRRDICLNLEEMGLQPESSHHEKGPGQNEIDFKYSDALSCADNLLTFKSVVKAIAARNGLFASFMPKPLKNHSGSGLHVNVSLLKNGVNLFGSNDEMYKAEAESFVAGILDKIEEITLFLNPTINSYERFGKQAAPSYISWSRQNRSQLIRIPAAASERSRMELRSPDPTINPYLAFALIIEAGISGIENNLKLPNPTDVEIDSSNAANFSDIRKLATNLTEAITVSEKSDFLKNVLGEEFLNRYISLKQKEISDYEQAEDKQTFTTLNYFNQY